MNLLLISNLFPTPVDLERGVFTLQLVRHLQAHCRVTVVCPLPWFPSRGPLARVEAYREYTGIPPSYEIDGITVHACRYPLLPRVSGRLHARLMRLSLGRQVASLHRREGFDLINSHWIYPDGAASAGVAQALGLAHVPTGLGCDINRDLFDRQKRAQVVATLESANEVIVVSNDLKREIEDNEVQARSISVIPNGIDFDKFSLRDRSGCRTSLGLDDDATAYLFVGRLSEEKGVASLIEAFAQLDDSDPRAVLYLVGDGPDRGELTDLAARRGIASRVRFVGKVEHAAIPQWMGAADFLCLPSWREGCPNVVLEALGSGRPVLASRVGAIPDVVSKDSGILFEPRNPDSIKDALERARSREWDAGKIQRSIAHLSWSETARRYAEVFARCLERRRQPGLQER